MSGGAGHGREDGKGHGGGHGAAAGAWMLHVGSAGCASASRTRAPDSPEDCAAPNRVRVALAGHARPRQVAAVPELGDGVEVDGELGGHGGPVLDDGSTRGSLRCPRSRGGPALASAGIGYHRCPRRKDELERSTRDGRVAGADDPEVTDR